MTLQVVDVESLPEGEAEKLAAVLTELQGLKVSVVAGGGANADLTLTGIATNDTLVTVAEVANASAAVSQKVVAGATATTPIAVTGLDTSDTLVSVLRYPAAGGPPTDLTGEATVTAGHVTLSTTDTSGDTLVVTYQETAGGASLVDVTGTASIHAANVIRNSVDTSGKSLLVVWFNKS